MPFPAGAAAAYVRAVLLLGKLGVRQENDSLDRFLILLNFERVTGAMHKSLDRAVINLEPAIRQFHHQPAQRERVLDAIQQPGLMPARNHARRVAARSGGCATLGLA